MNAGSAGPPPGDPADDPAEIGAYIQYAQEDIETSRMLFENGKLRHAAFFANEGLELCIKALMLRYKIIGKAIMAGHFPYPAVVDAMIDITESNMEKNPPNKEKLEQTRDALRTLKGAFKTMGKKELKVPLWKLSLNIAPADDEKRMLGECSQKFREWNEKMARIASDHERPGNRGHDMPTPDERGDLFATALKASKEKTGRQDPPPPSLPRGQEVPQDLALDMGQMVAIVEMMMHKNLIGCSSAHQQISRYPTLVEGVDSRELYSAHKDDLKNLLNLIYTVAVIILGRLQHGAPLLLEDAVNANVDVEKPPPA